MCGLLFHQRGAAHPSLDPSVLFIRLVLQLMYYGSHFIQFIGQKCLIFSLSVVFSTRQTMNTVTPDQTWLAHTTEVDHNPSLSGAA